MPDPNEGTASQRDPRRGWLDMPLIVEELQDQLDTLRDLVEAQGRQLAECRARLDAVERR